MTLQKIDNDYYPEMLFRMFVINGGPGFQLLWNTVKTFLDPTIMARIQVLDSKLLEVIDASELPKFLGDSCTCSDQGGCLRSEKGPWKNPNILKIILSGEAQSSPEMQIDVKSEEGLVSDDETSFPVIGSSETSTAESGSEMEGISSPIAEWGRGVSKEGQPPHSP